MGMKTEEVEGLMEVLANINLSPGQMAGAVIHLLEKAFETKEERLAYLETVHQSRLLFNKIMQAQKEE